MGTTAVFATTPYQFVHVDTIRTWWNAPIPELQWIMKRCSPSSHCLNVNITDRGEFQSYKTQLEMDKQRLRIHANLTWEVVCSIPMEVSDAGILLHPRDVELFTKFAALPPLSNPTTTDVHLYTPGTTCVKRESIAEIILRLVMNDHPHLHTWLIELEGFGLRTKSANKVCFLPTTTLARWKELLGIEVPGKYFLPLTSMTEEEVCVSFQQLQQWPWDRLTIYRAPTIIAVNYEIDFRHHSISGRLDGFSYDVGTIKTLEWHRSLNYPPEEAETFQIKMRTPTYWECYEVFLMN